MKVGSKIFCTDIRTLYQSLRLSVGDTYRVANLEGIYITFWVNTYSKSVTIAHEDYKEIIIDPENNYL